MPPQKQALWLSSMNTVQNFTSLTCSERMAVACSTSWQLPSLS
jgi:hypothetical protein